MKNLIYIFIILLSTFQNFISKAQITLDTTVTTWNAIGYDFYPVQISTSETKYYIQDTLTNSFSLYNLDFSPFILNINVPEPYLPFSANMEVIYLSRTLFDCDSTNIEYAYTSIGTGFHPFYVMRTDGTELFKLDSALAPWLLGTLNGSQDVRPIINTEVGAKLFLYYPENTNNLRIYSLCGSLITGLYNLNSRGNVSTSVQIYPIPSTGKVIFNISVSDNFTDYCLVIIDSNFREIQRENILNGSGIYTFDLSQFSGGIYYYRLQNKLSVLKAGKIIMTK